MAPTRTRMTTARKTPRNSKPEDLARPARARRALQGKTTANVRRQCHSREGTARARSTSLPARIRCRVECRRSLVYLSSSGRPCPSGQRDPYATLEEVTVRLETVCERCRVAPPMYGGAAAITCVYKGKSQQKLFMRGATSTKSCDLRVTDSNGCDVSKPAERVDYDTQHRGTWTPTLAVVSVWSQGDRRTGPYSCMDFVFPRQPGTR